MENKKLDAFARQLHITRSDHLPIVAAFCRGIGLIDIINRSVPNNMEVDVGTIIQGMVLDTLSGRNPLYRLKEFFEHQDTEVLLGREVPSNAFNDTTVGRAIDAVFEAGTEKTFSDVAFQAARRFPLDMQYMHFDTTSVSVWGDYKMCSKNGGTVNVTHGNSKDHRPDLKQFLIKMLCTNGNIPILGGCEDGNDSDKSINHTLLSNISNHLSRYGLCRGDFVYVADCAMVTEDNLEVIGSNLFVTRLPFNYSEADRVVSEAISEGCWQQLGSLAEAPAKGGGPACRYAVTEKTVTLYGKEYRAVVVYSTAHDNRRRKRIDRHISESQQALRILLDKEQNREYFCRADAEAAASRLRNLDNALHRIEAEVEEKHYHGPGRPPKNRPRKVVSTRYILRTCIEEKSEQIQRKRKEAGCFVLLANIPAEEEKGKSGGELLRVYKDQYGIEHNFGFLKDPLIVNDLFLKNPERIEVLGTVLLISLLVWNLIEHTLRQYIARNQTTLPGWDKKDTTRPTAFMMSTKFTGIQIVSLNGKRILAQPLGTVQKRYMAALGLSESDLLSPRSAPG